MLSLNCATTDAEAIATRTKAIRSVAASLLRTRNGYGMAGNAATGCRGECTREACRLRPYRYTAVMQWADRSDCLSDFFTDYTYTELPGVGHFTPLEATDKFAEAIWQPIRS